MVDGEVVEGLEELGVVADAGPGLRVLSVTTWSPTDLVILMGVGLSCLFCTSMMYLE